MICYLVNYYFFQSGQREGLLSEATSEEVDQADPFYAHCKLHSDKNQVKYVFLQKFIILSMRVVYFLHLL